MSDLLTDQEKRRCEARLKAYQCYILNNRQIAAAMTAFEKEWNSVQDPEFGEVFTDTRKLILRAAEKLESKFTLRTLTPPGPAEKITKQIILEAADIVAAGYMQDCYAEVNGKRYHFVEHRFFTSIKQAVLHNKRLAEILEKHDTTPKYLAAKFRKHCTGLHYHRLRMRCALTAKQMESRVTYCKEMLRVLELDPDFLRDIHWMDECTIWIGKDLISEKLHVWSYRSDTDGMAPEPNELFKSGKSFKVNLLLVVNARTGCTHAEVLTGTAGIRPADRYTTGMQHVMAQRSMMLGNPTYKTIASGFQDEAKGATREEIFDNTKVWIQTATEQAQQDSRALRVSWDNASIHRLDQCKGGYAELGIDRTQHIVLPVKSPDLHQVIEHCFGRLKAELVAAMYHVGWDNIDKEWVLQWVMDWCNAIEPETLEKDLENLPKLYHAVSMPVGQSATIDGERIVGTAGWYAKKGIS